MWNDTDIPLAYLISFRTYATWLHGDSRGSVDRFHNIYGTPFLPTNPRWHRFNLQRLRAEPLILGPPQRNLTKKAIRQTCKIRKWDLLALNVRTNHVHTVVSADQSSKKVLSAFKANATRELRQGGFWRFDFSPWTRKGSRIKLWNEESVARAINYVLYGQGDELKDFEN